VGSRSRSLLRAGSQRVGRRVTAATNEVISRGFRAMGLELHRVLGGRGHRGRFVARGRGSCIWGQSQTTELGGSSRCCRESDGYGPFKIKGSFLVAASKRRTKMKAQRGAGNTMLRCDPRVQCFGITQATSRAPPAIARRPLQVVASASTVENKRGRWSSPSCGVQQWLGCMWGSDEATRFCPGILIKYFFS